jgi:hypothetical protein
VRERAEGLAAAGGDRDEEKVEDTGELVGRRRGEEEKVEE